MIPFFLEGGRYTLGNVHYVAQEDRLVPAGETEFARDEAFGYRASNLREWVEEKTGGRVRADSVAAVSLDDIRVGGPARVAERLRALQKGSVCVVNAASRRDIIFQLAGSAGSRPGRIGGDVDSVKPEFGEQVHSFLELAFRLRRETNDDVRA